MWEDLEKIEKFAFSFFHFWSGEVDEKEIVRGSMKGFEFLKIKLILIQFLFKYN